MVAEAQKPLHSSTKGKEQRLVGKIALSTRVKARNLYVLQQLGAPEVAEICGLTPSQIYSLAHREGWTKVRAKIRQDSLKSQDARYSEGVDEMVEASALESAELVLSTFTKAKEAIAEGGPMAAKDVQAWSTATKNYVGIYRQAKQLDAPAAQQGAGSTLNLSLFFLGAPSAPARTEQTVQHSDAIDVTAHTVPPAPQGP